MIEFTTPSYGAPDRRPETAQTESGRVARHHNRKNGVRDPYGNVASERKK